MIKKFRIYDKLENEYCEEPDYRWTLSRNGVLYNSENDKYYYDEAYKIINPVKLGISPKGKGKTKIKKKAGMYNSLFDEDDYEDT